jgi:oxidase EvaA
VTPDRIQILAALTRSLVAREGAVCRTTDVHSWIAEAISKTHVRIERTALSAMRDWRLDRDRGRVVHRSGRFFAIEGIRVEIGAGEVRRWDQPIINQPEIGFLGCIIRIIDGVAHFLVQAKIEPGNINVVQLSPTLQATRSNYMRMHGGRTPHYLNEFIDPAKCVVVDQLQSEQGSRFLRKRNRNIIIWSDVDPVSNDQFRWLTLGQVKELCKSDNLVNMDLRTVVSAIPIDEIVDSPQLAEMLKASGHSGLGDVMLASGAVSSTSSDQLRSTLSWLTELKSRAELAVQSVSLSDLQGWAVSEEGIFDLSKTRFDVDWVSVEIDGREVNSWDQPIVRPHGRSLFAFLLRERDGVIQFLVQAKIECGNHDVFELGPTVQCTEYEASIEDHAIPFLSEVLSARGAAVIFDALQSEEGGRFYHDENRYMAVMTDGQVSDVLPPTYRWMTLRELMQFIKFNNYLNIQARVLLGALHFA